MNGKLLILWGLKKVVTSQYPSRPYAKAAAFYTHRSSSTFAEIGDFRRPNAHIRLKLKSKPQVHQSVALRIRPHLIEALTKVQETNGVIHGLWCNETRGKEMLRIFARLPDLRAFFKVLICQEDFSNPHTGRLAVTCHPFEFGTDPDGKLTRANERAMPPKKDLPIIRQRIASTLTSPSREPNLQHGLFLHQHCRLEHSFEMERVVAIEYAESKFVETIVRNLIEIPPYSMMADLLSHPESLFTYETHQYAGRDRYIMDKLTRVLLDIVIPAPDVRSLCPLLIL
ncbi:hypothetical protein XU18_3266 [Perkinsela sp. CCAP 1560/4]|nr:hypothetical protein XU18_3266 [Perkinsela sp. CCAP 1560/4]|eukprot:KNH05744.1 hypothetical protein XU18_3266 [Perkinsela sp. CCAP 1560/4]